MKNLNEQIERINNLSGYQLGVVINEQNEKWVKTGKKKDVGNPDRGKILAATMNIQNLIEKKGWLPGEYNSSIDKQKRELKSCKTKYINGEEYIDTTSCIIVRY